MICMVYAKRHLKQVLFKNDSVFQLLQISSTLLNIRETYVDSRVLHIPSFEDILEFLDITVHIDNKLRNWNNQNVF